MSIALIMNDITLSIFDFFCGHGIWFCWNFNDFPIFLYFPLCQFNFSPIFSAHLAVVFHIGSTNQHQTVDLSFTDASQTNCFHETVSKRINCSWLHPKPLDFFLFPFFFLLFLFSFYILETHSTQLFWLNCPKGNKFQLIATNIFILLI